MNIKKWVIVSTSMLSLLALLVLTNNSFASTDQSNNEFELLSTSVHDNARIKEVGMTFKDTTEKPKKDASQAVTSAKEYAPGYAKEAKKIEVEYHLVTNPDFKLFSKEAKASNSKLESDGFLLDTPCYIVTFKGIIKPGKSYAKDQPAKIFTEYSVVIDASTNQVLYGFSYR